MNFTASAPDPPADKGGCLGAAIVVFVWACIVVLFFPMAGNVLRSLLK